jgi:zona occludens toxin
MPIKAYIGLPRNGKSYEVVSHVIFNALKQGRRVVTNIAGVDRAAFVPLLVADGVPEENIGEILNVTHEDVLKPLFWKTDKDTEQGTQTVIQAGDLLALDEIWRFWDGFGLRDSEGNKRPDRVMNFFRMHGHFSHPVKGFTCEVALITQDIADIHRSVRGVVEETYRMTKLVALGSSKSYRVDIFSKAKVTGKPNKHLIRKYDDKYFPLYKSHSQKQDGAVDAIEENIDKRGNILSGKFFIIVLPFVIILGFIGFRFVWGFFHPETKEQITNAENTVINANNSQAAPVNQAAAIPQVNNDWLIKGYIQKKDNLVIVLVNNDGAYRYLINADLSVVGLDLKVSLDGQVLNNWQPHNTSNNSRVNLP